MADVTVEFGAKDVGFEKVLSQVREESVRLKNSLKGTELAMEDIEDVMRKIGRNDAMEKRIRSLGNTLDDTKKKQKASLIRMVLSEISRLDLLLQKLFLARSS